jgi:putative ATPase
MTLFEHRRQELGRTTAPLAARMRPEALDDFVGQEHLLGPGALLRRAIEEDRVPSMVLWGPPGSGKTTLARIIAHITKAHFEQLSAVSSGVADLRAAVEAARQRLGERGQRTILFIDEIHRFSKSQQDALLPYVEDGTVTLVGATTENPSFEVISPLLSRARVYTLNPLSDEHIGRLVDRALQDQEHGIGLLNVKLEPEARALLLRVANGDARTALDSLELAAQSTRPDASGVRVVTVQMMGAALQRQARYDREGDLHYDTVSAFIKCIRSSDPDAALYYLARMIDAGEDPLFIARRLVISASEDIGLADPQALAIAVAAQQAVHFVGMPEGRIPLAEAVVYLASAPKSNSAYAAIGRALQDVQQSRNEPVPIHLRNAPTSLMKRLGYGEGYKYAHDYEGHFVQMENLPDNLRGHRYYFPGALGAERDMAERLRRWWGPRYAPRQAQDRARPASQEET